MSGDLTIVRNNLTPADIFSFYSKKYSLFKKGKYREQNSADIILN